MSESNTDDETTTTVRRIGDPEPTESGESASETPDETANSGNAGIPPEQQQSLFDRDPEDIDPEEIDHLPETVQEAVMNPDSNYRGYFDNDDTAKEATQNEQDTAGSASNDEDGEDIPEPQTLSETGLVDEDGEFDWEDSEDGFLTDAEVSFGKGDEGDKFFYSGVPFELSYPNDDQKMENASRHLEGMQDMDSGRQKAARMRYMRELSEACYTVRGVPLEDVYLKDQRPIANVNGKNLADDSDATQLWSAATDLDKQRLGTRAHNFVEGTTKFRPR